MENKKLTICFFGEARKEDIHTLKWIRFFADNGHDVHLISYTELNDFSLKNIKMHVIKKKFGTEIWPFNTLLNLPFTVLWAKKVIREIKPDIIHAHCVTSYGTLASLLGFHPFVLTAWGSDILINPKLNFLTNWATKHALKAADLITCDADHMKNAMVKLGAKESKIKIVFFGVDTEKFKPGEKDRDILKKHGLQDFQVVISLRRLEPIYDVGTLIKAIPKILKECQSAKFIIAGGGSEEKLLKDLVKELDISEKVEFTGWTDPADLVKYLNSSDVYVSTSLSDGGIASSTAEAMACGLPAVITDSGDNKDWIKDKEDGFIVPVKSPDILAEKIILLLKDSELRARFGYSGRKIIEERNNYYKEMRKMESDYIILSDKSHGK